ncbi:MAG: hypothetical protein GAK33_01958 [Burkholderia lata]|uniref:Uncharacterized protein n=1 Tax=Burkholderia lata (strain ATCC 17760 / DSM 23089 / LMG 22485 / NCIMB 9086 / R18194 / 383) TaxID=482957 RepID=A0A833PPQ6_BURL3|nr:hypothetical protein [Burkholderia lata]KAF1038622.1 MAG: hypothetical protein GAK33_01958 [Burkholderia lata]
MAVEDGGFDEVEVLNAIPCGTGKHNPALDYTPTWRGYDDAMDRLTYDPERLANGWMESDGTANFATEAQARLIQVLVTNIVQSRLERNPADFAFQARLYDSASFIADSEDAHGRSIQSLAIDVPTAGARGLFVSIPADMGEHSLVNSVERFIGTSSHRFYVDAQAGGRFDVSLVKSLTVPFPETGSPRSFVDTMLKKMDSVVNGGYSTHKTGPFHRDRDDLANAMSGLAIQHNLGALLVPNLTVKAVTQSAAWVLLGALARFTDLSGIPIVCFGTTGAAVELYQYGKSLNSLRNKGGVSITAFRPEEAQWSLWAEYLWDNYFVFSFRHPMPEWFPNSLWHHTLGHTELATKLAAYAHGRREIEDCAVLDTELLKSYADVALELDIAPLTALRLIHSGKFTMRRGVPVRRYADWLPLDSALMTAPTIDETPLGIALSNMRSA